MNEERFENTASTSPKETSSPTGVGASTNLPEDAVRFRTPGRFLAGVVLGAGLLTGATQLSLRDLYLRRHEDVTQSSTEVEEEVDPLLLKEIRDLFEQGASEFFQDGMYSNFSRTLLKILSHRGRAAFRAISEYLFTGNAKPDVVSEALRWLADFNDPSTLSQRWAILQRTLKDHSARVRDGAILGFASLDDPRARQLLMEARGLEQIAELRTLIDQVITQLDRRR